MILTQCFHKLFRDAFATPLPAFVRSIFMRFACASFLCIFGGCNLKHVWSLPILDFRKALTLRKSPEHHDHAYNPFMSTVQHRSNIHCSHILLLHNWRPPCFVWHQPSVLEISCILHACTHHAAFFSRFFFITEHGKHNPSGFGKC